MERWLEGRPQDVAVALAVRSALRALPGIMDNDNATIRRSAIPVCRAILTASVAAVGPTADVKRAALSAHSTVQAVDMGTVPSVAHLSADAADEALYAALLSDAASAAANASAYSATATASSSSAAFYATYDAAASDAEALAEAGDAKSVFQAALWSFETGDWDWSPFVERFLDLFDADPTVWGFWARWYRAHLEPGARLDWDLWERIVREMSEDDWTGKPEAVAARIAEIEAIHRTEVAPPLIRDEDAGLFRIKQDPPVAEDTLRFARERIEFAMDTALAATSGNALTETSYEIITVRLALTRHPADASLLAAAFYDACLSLQTNIGDRYPEDTSLINLQNALYATTEEICEQSEAARKRCARLAGLARPSPPTRQDRADAPEIAEAVASAADEEAQAVIRGDAQIIAEGEIVPKWVRARFTNYVTTIVLWLDRAKKGDARVAWLVKRMRAMIVVT